MLLAAIGVSGIAYAAAKLQLALCFHHAVLDAQDDLATAITRLRELTQSGDYASYVDIAHFMAGLPLPEHTARARWVDGEQQTRERWRHLVTARRDQLATTREAFHTCADHWSTRRDYDRRSWTGWSAPRN